MATKLELPEIVRGDDYALVFRFWTSKTKTTRVDVSGRAFTAQARSSADSSDPTSFVIDHSDDGEITLHLDSVVTAGLPPGVLHWDLQQASPAKTTLFKGIVPVTKDVTRP